MNKTAFNGERLKEVRQLRGLSLSALADKTELTKQTISLYENNNSVPEFDNGLKLANALRVPYNFFFFDKDCYTSTGTTYFRSLTSSSKIERQQQIKKLEYVAKMREALMEYVSFPTLNIPKVNFNGADDEFDDSAQQQELTRIEEIAHNLRKRWHLGDGPITDLQYEVEANGIVVTGFATGTDNIDAFSQRIDIAHGADTLFAIAVGLDSKPEGRINFDIAHELGHILLHPWSEDVESISKEEFRKREIQANHFAGAFLLPISSFGKDVSYYGTDINHYEQLKKKWKVSIQAMIVRSWQIQAITSSQYQYLFRKLSKNGWRKREPGDLPYDLRENVFQGAINLLKENNYKSSDILALFTNYGAGFYAEEIESLLHLAKGTLSDEEPKQFRILKLREEVSNNI